MKFFRYSLLAAAALALAACTAEEETLKKGETVFIGDIHAASGTTPYEVCIRETSLKGVTPTVHFRGTVPVSHSVMWSNHRIACIEPYNIFTALPGHPFHWSIRYTLSK